MEMDTLNFQGASYQETNNNNNTDLENLNLDDCDFALLSDICPEKSYDFVNLESNVEYILEHVTDSFFRECFSFDKVLVRCLLMDLHRRTFYPYYDPYENIKGSLSFDMSVLATLSYLVKGDLSMLDQLPEFDGYTRETIARSIVKTCEIFVHFLTPDYITFPSSMDEQHVNKVEFLGKFGVPGVVGVLDCYYIPLQNVPEDEMKMYLHRNIRVPTVAVQLICDQNYRILDINSRFSGRTHGSYIWRHSHINSIMKHSQKRNPKTWLIADRGYHLTSGLINPYRNCTDPLQSSFNVALNEIQKVNLKTFEILRSRFRCLNTVLPFEHCQASNVITTCATLHNYLLAKLQTIDDDLLYQLPKVNILPNAHQEDAFSETAVQNREFIKGFMFNNSMQVLYQMRKNSNISFVSSKDDIGSMV